jgi:adenylate cyclase
MEVVDIETDPLAERSRRRRTLLRIGLPIGGVGLIIGFLLGIAIYADSANRAGVLGLSDTLLQSIQQRIALQVSAYLEPAAHATLLAHSMLGRGGAGNRAEEAYAFAASVLQETPQIANVLFADAAGNFMLVTRTPDGEPGSTDTKRVVLSPAGRTAEWITRNGKGQVTARREDPSDTYDARTRSWFIGARKAADVFWSSVYVFFTERAPGVTAAVHGPDADPDVVAVDIRLDALSGFLSKLSIGRTGRAYIVTKDGELVAGPDPRQTLRTQDGQLMSARVDGIGDADLAASWDHFRLEGAGNRIIEVNGRRLISIVTPLVNRGEDWQLFITVPETEFSGFVTTNSRRAALLSLIVVAIAVGLAVLLVLQGLRADRADRMVAQRSEAVRVQSAAFARLTTEAGMFDAAGTASPALTETVAEATGARRAALWRLLDGDQVLRCEDSFEPATGDHLAGLELSGQEVPAFIEAIARGEEIDAPDARRDRRTATLHSSLMAPLGSTALFAVPVIQGGATVGVLMLEDARRDAAALNFARACATLVGLHTRGIAASSAGPEPGSPQEAPGEAARGTPPESSQEAPRRASVAASAVSHAAMASEPAADTRGLDTLLASYAGPNETIGLQGNRQAAVLVLLLPDTAMARVALMESERTAVSLAQRIAAKAQEMATAHRIPYVKMLGTTIVAAAGYGVPDAPPDGTSNNVRDRSPDGAPGGVRDIGVRDITDRSDITLDAAQRLADVALALRASCASLFMADDGLDQFGLGLDVGLVLGSVVGGTPGLFNIWGAALQSAEALAASAPAGAIQTSEQAYLVLRQGFLFRPRGLFYRPHVGETRSYVLAGRA